MQKLKYYSIFIGLIFFAVNVSGRAQSCLSSGSSRSASPALVSSRTPASESQLKSRTFSGCPDLTTTDVAYMAAPSDVPPGKDASGTDAGSEMTDGSSHATASRSESRVAGRNGGGPVSDAPLASGLNNASIVSEQARLLLFGSGLILIGGLLRRLRFGARDQNAIRVSSDVVATATPLAFSVRHNGVSPVTGSK